MHTQGEENTYKHKHHHTSSPLWKHTENEDHPFTEETKSILTKAGLMDKSTGQVNDDVRQIVSQYIRFEGASLSTRNPLQEDSDDENSKVAATTQP